MKKLVLLILMISCFGMGSISTSKTQINETFDIKLVQKSTQSDEFINYWYYEFRLIPTCDVTYEQYKEMYDKYNDLTKEDKEIIDNLIDVDPNYTIKQVIDTLTQRFYKQGDGSKDERDVLDQTSTLIIISTVAIFGMSMILVFYMLKNKHIID